MKVCLISEEFPPETGWGGIGTHIYNLSLALTEMGHKVHVVSKSVDGKEHISGKGDLTIFRLPECDDDARLLKAISIAAPYIQKAKLIQGFSEFSLRSLRRGAAISRWLKDRPPFDIIEAPDYGAEAFWCQFLDNIKVPIVIKLHTPLFLTQRLNLAPEESFGVKLRKWMEKYSITHAAKIISPTKSIANVISKEFSINGIEVVPNCVDTDLFLYKEKEPNIKEKSFLYAGRLERRKGVEVLAKAIPLVVKAMPDVKFRFIGRDTHTVAGRRSMKEWLMEYFEEGNLCQHIEILNEVPRTEMVKYYQHADVCVLPSLWENLPYTCLEAMSCGTPVVASRVGGFPEIITEGVDGILFETGSHEDLAKKMIQITTGEDLIELGKKARKKIEATFNHKIIAENTIDLYKKVLKG
jgi:glycosyltransferase involved in cell wall biosynthesis